MLGTWHAQDEATTTKRADALFVCLVPLVCYVALDANDVMLCT